MCNYSQFIFSISFVFLLTACTSSSDAESDLSKQNTSAVLWVQQSAEYRALVLQAFNIAKYRFDNAPNIYGRKKAVVVDIDETILSNIDYEVKKVNDKVLFSNDNWNEWISSETAKALPGALEFVKHIVQNGGEIFYVSNRKLIDYNHTYNNLIALGFPHVSNETLLLRKNILSKKVRFNKIINSKYDIILFVGDNLDDFDDFFYHKKSKDRIESVDKHNEQFGYRFVILPNPIYGTWENVLTNNYPGLDLIGKRAARLNLIKENSFSN